MNLKQLDSFKKMSHLIKHKKGWCLVFSLAIVTSTILDFPIIALLSQVSNEGNYQVLQFSLTPTLRISLVIILFGLKIISSFIGLMSCDKIQRYFHYFFASNIFNRIIKDIEVPEINKQGIGHFQSLAGDETFKLSSALSSLVGLSGTLFSFTITFGLLIWISPKAAIAFAIFLISVFLINLKTHTKVQQLGETLVNSSRIQNTYFAEGINNLKSLRSLDVADYAYLRFEKALKSYTEILFRNDLLISTIKLLPTLMILIFFSLFISTLNHNEISLLMPTAYLYMRLLPLSGQIYSTFLRINSDIKSINDIYAITHVETYAPKGKDFYDRIKQIELQKVAYGFDENLILGNINLTFEEGYVYGVKGPSGVGKSTLFDILLGFKQDYVGDISVNNTKLRDINPQSLRKKIHLCEQTTSAFWDSFENNILLGRDLPLEKELVQKFGLETIENREIQFASKNISGGQRQRLSVLRTIIDHPEVLIIDESFSGVESTLRPSIMDEIRKRLRSSIIIIISHDQSTLDLTDKIIDLGDFRIS